ncbi:MAG: NADH-quinone oxidoreductase subunit C [Planctomycetes bacterium]|nr:NADH-quinone oxidoreductase subunit C [Planctomycetota bacterium]
MNIQEIADKLKGRFGDSVEFVPVATGDSFIMVKRESLIPEARFLHETPELYFDSLMCLTGVDYPDNFTVVYHLFSTRHLHKLVLKVSGAKDSLVQSVSGIWPTANWFERETYDLLGVKFDNHPNLTRILLPDDWTGHPLRKDYQYPKTYQGCPCEI